MPLFLLKHHMATMGSDHEVSVLASPLKGLARSCSINSGNPGSILRIGEQQRYAFKLPFPARFLIRDDWSVIRVAFLCETPFAGKEGHSHFKTAECGTN